MSFDVEGSRAQFPALAQKINGLSPVFLDNPAGTQVPNRVIDAVSDYYRTSNANSGGFFSTSQQTDQIKQRAREHMMAFLNARRPEEILLGPNMTTLTMHISRAIGQTLAEGDEIILTQMDHDANIRPWTLMAADHGVTVKWVRLDVESGTLDLDSYEAALSSRTKWVCVGHAANALGTINPIARMAKMAHDVGAQIYVDAVQSAPHIPIDVQALDIDFLACSAYKFYGPHLGIVYGRYDLLEALNAYKVIPADDNPPEKWETGTATYELIAGLVATIDYLASYGKGDGLREQLLSSYAQIMVHENALTWQLIEGLQAIPSLEIRGIVDPKQSEARVPTVIFRDKTVHPDTIAQQLAQQGIFAWSGHYYAVETMKALGYLKKGGMVRLGLAHYNTSQDIERTLGVLQTVINSK